MEIIRKPEDVFNELVEQIKSIILTSRSKVRTVVNDELLLSYWNIGKQIIEKEQEGNLRAQYGTQLLLKLSKQLTKELGKGFSRSNLQNMRSFYTTYQKCQTLSGKLSWSHYCELISLEDTDKRSFYEQETINSNWSVRELQ